MKQAQQMSIEPHLMSNETVLKYCNTENWIWVSTDQRVLKYREGKRGSEELHDLSYDEITGISLVNTGRNNSLRIFGSLTILAGAIYFIYVSWPGRVWGILFAAIGSYLLYRWMNSEESYFEFRGSGLLDTESDQWKIRETDADDPDEIRDFVTTVRGQL